MEEVGIVEAAEEDAGCGASSAVVVLSDAVSLLSLLSVGVGGGGGGVGGGGVGGGDVGGGVGVGLSRGTIRGAGKVEGVSGRMLEGYSPDYRDARGKKALQCLKWR